MSTTIIDPLGTIESRPDVGPQLPIVTDPALNAEQISSYVPANYNTHPVTVVEDIPCGCEEKIDCPKPDYRNHCLDEDPCNPRKKIMFLGFDINSPIFWAYFVIVVVTGILLYYIHFGTNLELLNTPTGSYLIGWIISFVIFLWAGYFGYIAAAPDYRRQNLLNIAFALNLILAVIWAVLYFQLEQPFEAFWIMLILIFVVLWWIYLLWDVDRLSAYFMFIHLAFVIYYAYLNFVQAESFNIVGDL